MSTPNKSNSLPVAVQTTNNTTSWIGHRSIDNKNVVGGQTFLASSEGDLESIEVFSSMVTNAGNVKMTLHSFDTQQNKWGPQMGSVSVQINQADSGKWMSFNIPGMHLDQGKAYGFKLESPDAFIGVGEAVGSSEKRPFNEGQEWKFTNNNQQGDAYSYFSLAFKVGVKK